MGDDAQSQFRGACALEVRQDEAQRDSLVDVAQRLGFAHQRQSVRGLLGHSPFHGTS
jgi:hypothetical protein